MFTLKQNRTIARYLALVLWKLSKKNKHITQTNINKCFPHLNQKQQEEMAKKTMASTISNFLELATIWNESTSYQQYVDNIYGQDDFSAALKQANGLLLAVPHMGNWEVLNMVLDQFDKYAFLYKPPSDKKIENLLKKYRGQSNALQIEANLKGVRKIMKHLKNKGFVTILPDQKPKSGQGVFAPFYGIPTYTMSLFSRLALKTKVPVFFAYTLRTENGFDVYFEQSNEEIYKDLETSVAYMNQKIQEIVEKAPEQYQWTYKRFSIQADGEQNFY